MVSRLLEEGGIIRSVRIVFGSVETRGRRMGSGSRLLSIIPSATGKTFPVYPWRDRKLDCSIRDRGEAAVEEANKSRRIEGK